MNVNNNEVLLGDLAVLYDSLHKTPKTYIEDGYPMIRVTDIERGSVRTEGTMRVDEKIYEEFSKKHKPIIGDIILTRVGSYGNSAIVADDEPFCLGQNTVCISPIREKVHPYYLYYCLNSRFVLSQFDSFITGASQPTISLKSIRTVRLLLPRMETQRRISKILSTYDNLIENNRHRIHLLEQAARLLYKEWFVHLRFPGHEHVKIKDGVPEGWEKGTIADFFDTTSGGTPSRKTPEFFTGDINWVKTQELNEDFIFETEERITEEALKKSSAKLFPENTLLVSIYGGTNIGRTGILAQPAASNQACVALFPKHPSANHIYAQLFFQHVREYLIGIAQGAAQTNISQDTLRKVSMLMPPESLMLHFLQSVSVSYEQLKNLARQNATLAKARDLLLPRLMNGEIAA